MKKIVSDFLELINTRIEGENQKIKQAKDQIIQSNKMIEECLENIAFFENQKQLTIMQSSESHPVSHSVKPVVHRKRRRGLYEYYRGIFCSIRDNVETIYLPEPADASKEKNMYTISLRRPYSIGVCVNTLETNTLTVFVKFNKDNTKWFDHFKKHVLEFQEEVNKSVVFRQTGIERKIELTFSFDPTSETSTNETALAAAKTIDAFITTCKKYEYR